MLKMTRSIPSWADVGQKVRTPHDYGIDTFGTRVKRQWLSWHYRSQDESLIAFSNQQYYDSKLSTFPAPSARGSSDHGVSLVRVEGQFQRSGKGKLLRTNPIEAEAIVAEMRRRFMDSPEVAPSIGVITFNAQRAYIESLIRDCDDPRLAEALDGTEEEGLFVKNLENVQGDERDVILFSTAFSANDKGMLPLNFGPLNRPGGERRLNVAVTRARRRVIVFSSFDPRQLRAEETSSVGIKHLRAYLDMAAEGTDALPQRSQRPSVVDRHAEEIAGRLRERGLVATTNVGLSEFKVDISVATADEPTQAIMAILLDGPAWAARRTVGDRDGLPSDVLTHLLKWPAVERVWLPTWLADPDSVVDHILKTADELRSGIYRADTEAVPEAPADPWAEPQRTVSGGIPTIMDPDVYRDRLVDGPSLDSRIASIPTVDAVPLPPSLAAETSSHGHAGQPSEPVLPGHELLPGEVPFVPGELPVLGTVEVLDGLGYSAQDNRSVAAAMKRVVDEEGPVHEDRLVRIVASSFGLNKVHKNRRAAILEQLPASFFPDSAERVAWSASLDYRTWAGFRSSPDGAERTFDHVPLREIVNAMVALCSVSAGMAEPELKREALGIFGGRRMTGGISGRLDRTVELGLSSGRLHRGTGETLVA